MLFVINNRSITNNFFSEEPSTRIVVYLNYTNSVGLCLPSEKCSSKKTERNAFQFFWNAFFFLTKGFHFFGTCYWSVSPWLTFPTKVVEEKQMKLTPDSSRDIFWYNSMNSIQQCAPIVRSSNCFQNINFLKSGLSAVGYESS